jgi:hypothetical protein
LAWVLHKNSGAGLDEDAARRAHAPNAKAYRQDGSRRCAKWQAATRMSTTATISRRQDRRGRLSEACPQPRGPRRSLKIVSQLQANRSGAIDELAWTRRCAAFPDSLGRASAPEMGDRHVNNLRSPEPARCHRLSVGCGHCGIDIPWPNDQEFDHPDARNSRSIHGASGPRSCRHDAIVRQKFHILELRPEPQSRMTRNPV